MNKTIKKIELNQKKIKELKLERDSLNQDSFLIPEASSGASKISKEETPTEEEENCLEELKSNYPSFFEDNDDDDDYNDYDEEENQVETNPEDSPSLLDKVNKVSNYIEKEIKANQNNLNKLLQKDKDLKNELFESSTNKKGESSKLGVIERGESSKSVVIERGESSKSVVTDLDKSTRTESFGPRAKRVKIEALSSEKGKAPLVESTEDTSNDKGKGKAPLVESTEDTSNDKGKGKAPSFDEDDLFYNPFDDIGTD